VLNKEIAAMVSKLDALPTDIDKMVNQLEV